MTPLYKRMKANGTSFYAFPGAAEDISAAYQNQNYKMYFSKYVLLNFPKQVVTVPEVGLSDQDFPKYFDFNDKTGYGFGFKKSLAYNEPDTFQDELIESLRNYIANYEITMKQSKINNNEYYYDNTLLSTPTEKIFWKWCKKLNLMSLEPANSGDEYFGNLVEFQSRNQNDPTYFNELLWKEREVVEYTCQSWTNNQGYWELRFDIATNLQVGDWIEFTDFTAVNLVNSIGNNKRCRITNITEATSQDPEIVLTDLLSSWSGAEITDSGTVTLIYHRLVQYIGEVNGINNVQQANRSYTEVYIHIPDSTGQTPDILFRVSDDKNYKPNMSFPILPSQYQPEIVGAEVFSNPIVNNPNAYPGSYYGFFDSEDFTYDTSSGDSLRRSGDYYGVNGNIETATIDSRHIDGIVVDFDPLHYVKMNIFGKEINNFDQFNAMEVNNQPPMDFEFNAILWYYTVEDSSGNKTNNLYGISFVDNPNNNPIDGEQQIRVPAFRKLAANNLQDGTSYAFSLNLNFNIINENPQDTFNPEAINSLFSFNLFNEAMRRLSVVNDSFMNILVTQNQLQIEINNMKQLLYSQTDFQVINKKITNLETLLRLYATNQMVDSDTIRVEKDNTSSPPLLKLKNIDPPYESIYYNRTSQMYNINGAIVYNVTVPMNKGFLVYIENDDLNNIVLPNNDVLTILLDKDLSYRQYFDLIVDSNSSAITNKQLDLFVKYTFGNSSAPVESRLLPRLDLPIYYNTTTQLPNSAASYNKFNFDVDLNRDIVLSTGGRLSVPIDANLSLMKNHFREGDTLVLDNFNIGTSSQSDFSGQYRISGVGATNSYIFLDVNSNLDLVNYGASSSLPLTLNSTSNYLLSNYPYFKYNKGVRYRITRINPSDFSELSERYLVEKIEMMS
jgi:hypothetical protein